jgi:predicted SAM-dependent methyltransferase
VRYGTARRLEFPPNSLDAFYTSHTLEHLSRKDCVWLLNRIRVWLKPGGVLRVALPDLKRIARAYVNGEIDADRFVERTYLARIGDSCVESLLSGVGHRWMYDEESFRFLLCMKGYREIDARQYRMSRLAALTEMDLAERKEESFYIEAVK